MPNISIYKNAFDKKGTGELDIYQFLLHIKEGKWQDQVLQVRTVKDKDARNELKKKVPMVTIAGTFSERSDKSISKHSGFICIDIDNIGDLSDLKSQLYPDPYIYGGFDSIGGYGLCLIIPIKPKKHREAFAGICEYMMNKYGVVCDPTSVNESRARFISYDPNLQYNPNAITWDTYPQKQVPNNKIPKIIFAQNDFENIIAQIVNRGIDLMPSYHEWLRIGFALADKFGEGGRNYFHTLSGAGNTYNTSTCDKQYTACLKGGKSGVTIASLYYYAHLAGIETVSKETKMIAQTAQNNKKGEKTKEDAREGLKKEGLANSAQAEAILDQVFDQNINAFSDDSLISKLTLYLRQSYNLRRNIITRKIEENGKPLDDMLFNDIWCDAFKIFDKVTSEMLQRLINSSFTKDFNPFLDFIAKYQMRKPSGAINRVFDSVLSSHYEFTRKFGTKWLVGLIATIHGAHSPLMLVLSGTLQGTGKTEFFRRLLPSELLPYYAESKLDAGKDDEILMTQKLLIMDDEMGGKSKKDEMKLKEMLSRQTFSLREPYGRNNIDLNRLAVLCGTTNNEDILNDPTGNRRIIPIAVYGINHQQYNAVDKIDLFMEAYWLYKSGFNWELTRDDVTELNNATTRFEKFSLEYEIINKNYNIPEDEKNVSYFTASEIKIHLELKTMQKLSIDRIGKEMQRIGFKQVSKRVNGLPRKVYEVTVITD